MERFIKKHLNIFLILVLIFGFLVRLYKITNPIADWHSWRQADTASVSWFFAQDGINLLVPRYHDISKTASGFENPQGFRFAEFPLFNALHALAFSFLGKFSFEVWGRLISVFASIGSTIFVFLIGRYFLGKIGGLLAAFFFAFLPFNIYFSRVILPEPLAVFLATGGIWFFICWIDKTKLRPDIYFFLSAVFFSLALLVKPYTVFYASAPLYLVFVKYGKKTFLHPALWFLLTAVLVPFFLWRGWMWNDEFLRGIPHWKWVFNGDTIRFRPAFWWWIFGQRLGQLILGVWLAVPFVLGLTQTVRRYSFFLQSFIFGQFLYVAVVATANVRHDYYQTLTIPAVTLVLAAGIMFLKNLPHLNPKAKTLVILGSVVAGLFISLYQIKEFYKINHPEIILAGKAADKILPKDALVIAPYNGDTAFLYQTRRRGWPIMTAPIDEMISRLGATHYVSVNFDKKTEEIMERYKVMEKTDKYVIVQLVK